MRKIQKISSIGEPFKIRQEQIELPADSLIMEAFQLLFPEETIDKWTQKKFIEAVKKELLKIHCCVLWNRDRKGTLAKLPYLNCGKKEVLISRQKINGNYVWGLAYTHDYHLTPREI